MHSKIWRSTAGDAPGLRLPTWIVREGASSGFAFWGTPVDVTAVLPMSCAASEKPANAAAGAGAVPGPAPGSSPPARIDR